ncbi:SO2930 family diheme c-type cytochrome [Sphingomonas cavernae]|uniref:Repeat protein (TIGR03806 family) n=1 Tax=Sphingomonas cavernae TaxID=2320861 RepID=A0A418WJJ5_9SPHN|nr:SO2930 family diheme c-type cytochrome [Sphingomonas cavernae]RJF90194.1 hypothetical protein D3876_07860 [Sphingomonas cavernae]
MIRLLGVLSGWLALTSAAPAPSVALNLIVGDTLPPRLSDFRFFVDAAATRPNARVEPYALNTALFSDYAEKFRFIYVPPGKKISYTSEGVLDFPVGSALIKTFGYPADMRVPDKNIRVLETRLLLRRESGWVALPYVWNAERTEAVLKRGGTRLPVSWIDAKGARREISYAVPNQNQCKECHGLAGEVVPIGPKARNLNDGAHLQRLYRTGILDKAPDDAPLLPRWDDPRSGTVALRARAYLDVNCAHCHNRKGAASNSGLFLAYEEPSAVALGIGKVPVAAGRGSGGLALDIAPGHPEQSILLYRMKSTEPGIAMPELGRATVHDEAIVLLGDWISRMPTTH